MIKGETNGYVLSLKIGYTVIDDTINGFLKPINKQVEMVCQQIAEDPQLQVRKLFFIFPFILNAVENNDLLIILFLIE